MIAAPPHPLTVLHIDTERGWRGGERQALWLAEGLVARGHRSLIAARPAEPLAVRAAELGLTVIPCEPWAELDLIAAARLRRVVQRERVDIVHAHTGHAAAIGGLAKWGTSAKLVLTRRVDFPLKSNAGTRWKYRQASGIIAVSRAVAGVLVSSGIARDRIHVVPSGVDLTRRLEPAPPSALRALGVPAGAPLVVQVAALVDHKDPITFVRAIAAARREVPGLQALMVGEGPLRPVIQDTIAALGLAGAVHLAGYRFDTLGLLALADVVTLSSREEGLGTSLIDALFLGKPAAATAAGGIPEVVVDGISGLLVPPGDHAALGAAIARLVTDRPLGTRLAAGARVRAQEFSVERTVDRTIEVYRKVLSSE
ncbi:MAG: glycosyltransferase family 4 protein [Gemmatimonadota bacterium]|nr:glycosyltransferase family 4 protein [Gemmatimonadota bacterium]